MNRIFIITLYAFCFITSASAQQVGIGTTQPDASAALEINSTDKGLLIPRVDLGGTAVASPATGLLVFNTNDNYAGGSGLYINMGTSGAPQWRQLVPNTAGTFIRNQSMKQANSNFHISGDGHIGGLMTVKQIGVNKYPTPGYELDVNGTMKSNTVTAQQVTSGNVQAATITATQYVDMGIQYLSSEYSIPANARAAYVKICPAGYQLIGGGGGHRDYNSSAPDIKINYSGPDPANPSTRWKIIATNTGNSSRIMIAYCNCAKIR